MGFSLSKIIERLTQKKKTRILMLGLNAAGKTNILFKLKLGEVFTTIPTIGFNVENVEFKNMQWHIWDVGTDKKFKPLWRHYYDNVQALIYVVDSSDRDRIELAKEELSELLNEELLKDTCLLVLANKQDRPTAMTVGEMTEALGLQSLDKRTWHIQGMCAFSGEGLYDGLEWLSKVGSKRK